MYPGSSPLRRQRTRAGGLRRVTWDRYLGGVARERRDEPVQRVEATWSVVTAAFRWSEATMWYKYGRRTGQNRGGRQT